MPPSDILVIDPMSYSKLMIMIISDQ